ncbi:LIM and SH3 domain protein 1 isoform X1 [Lingula anatina]|uniref:LIM and SH3 domain protein 1 isoform X1 n=1 Tax=Lingula anatina TaxID=7574 RepID=A0A1S3K6R0_LINAN|nr:LIM and SH3 domain protein 1 isoform X1 [Lingula anatina]XP_023930734.1 LIM and SH3 domain protein 1 isoform X1 [Lingula anatina]|eukprot:XP_023930732.1 LIM and SH3 domain protein 1 isoform X1 [Lingula anatina]
MPIKNCGKCGKTVYPTEELKCLDKVWHKMCFKCEVCNMTLNMKNYKGYDKRPYCNTHYPTTKFTAVADTPENRRIAKNTQVQSNIKYHQDFEKQKGSKISVADDPENLRVKKLSQNISNVAYHGELERKAEMEQRRPDQEYDVGSAPPPGYAPQDRQPMPANQPYRRQPGSLADYDPMMREEARPSPYSAKVQSTQVYNSGRVETQPQDRRKVGSIADYDPVNENYGSLAGGVSSTGQGYQQPPPQQYQPPPPSSPQHQPVRPSGGYVQQQEQEEPLTESEPPEISEPLSKSEPALIDETPDTVETLDNETENEIDACLEPVDLGEGQIGDSELGIEDVLQEAPPVSTQYYAAQEPERSPGGYGYQPPPPQMAPQSQGKRFMAVYDYTAADTDEVSFNEGDIIINCESIDEGWMTGTVSRTGQHGMLPANYVEPA